MKFSQRLSYTFCLLFFASSFAHAAVPVTVNDNYGIPSSKILVVESPGVLANDNGGNAEDDGVTVTLQTSVTKGVLSCPDNFALEICEDGSFQYVPDDILFDGEDTFQYTAHATTGETASATVTLSACTGGPTIFSCWHENAYLAKLSEFPSYNIFTESFEGTAWDIVRSPDIGTKITAPEILSKGITWTTNFPLTNGITTGSGAARTGSWGGFDPLHGLPSITDPATCDVDNPPIGCRPHDGLSGDGSKLHAVGGYFSGTAGANIAIILDGDDLNPVSGGILPDTNHHFFGVIDTSPSGFSHFELRELDGKFGQELFIFADDFTIATTAAVTANNPPVLTPIGDRSVNENVKLTINLTVTDDDGDSHSYSMTDGPAGATLFDNGDGTASFVWRPTFSQAGSYPVTFTVTDNGIPVLSDSETITITVNDVVAPAGDLQFSSSNYSVGENGINKTITVVRVGGSSGTVGVDYTTGDGTATAGSDYTTNSGTLSLADGVLSKTFTVVILDDIIYEGNETLSLTLSNPTGGASLGTPASATLTITENDPLPSPGSLQFSGASYNVAENGGSALITVTRTGGSFGIVSVNYASSDGSATAGSDYTTATGTLTFLDGVVSQSFSVPVLDDVTYEGNETLSLNLTNPTGGASLGAPASVTLTINEDDPVPPAGSLQFSGASYNVAENGGSALITVTRTGGSFGAASVNYATSNGSASAGSDYTAASGTLNFADGVISQTFNVPITNDSTWEGDETVNLNLSGVSGASLGLSSAVLTITEDDPTPPSGSLQFSAASYSVAENGSSALITVTRSGGSFGAASVNYATSNGSASAGSDYTAASGTLNFADGDAVSKTFSVAITNDSTWEGNETVNLNLSGATGASLGAQTSAVLTINEDDPLPPAGSLQFSAASYSVAENGTSATITVTRTGGSFGAASVNYATSNGSASAGSDYTAASGTLNFADGVISQTFNVPITNDSTWEGDETVNLKLSAATGASLGGQTSAVLSIIEDDPLPPAGSLQFSAASYSVAENGSSATITVTRTGGSFGAASVNYATSNGSASAGSDYTAASGTLNFADGDAVNKTFTVFITNDSTWEDDETVNLNLNAATGASLGGQTSAVLSIIEDDPLPSAGSLQFSGASYNVAEDGSSALITVTRTGGSFGTVGVDYSTIAGGSATAGSDYVAASGSLTFADGVVSKTFSVDIIDDANYEGDETVNLLLSNASGADLGIPSSAVLSITENEPVPPSGSLQFSAPSYIVNENGVSALITVTRVGGSFGTVGVDYASADGSASAGSDYTTASGSLSFADGVISQSFSVGITDDADYEGDETLSLSLSNPTGGAGLGSPASATLTITEDDPVPPSGSLQFSTASYNVAENGTTATVTVTRVGGSFGTVGVDYGTGDGTAVAGSDYTAINSSLSFADGVMSQTFSISILDDISYEGDETVNLTLSNPTGGAGLGSPASATLNITEDDPVPPAGSLQFSGASYSVAENGSSALITVARTGGSFGSVSVDYASSDGSATAGSDYTAVSGTLTFLDGVVSQSFSVPVLDDAAYEGNETMDLSLSNPTGGAGLGSPASATLNITEDDPVPPAGSLQFSGASYNVAENGGSALITVARTGGSFGSVSVNFASSDGSATAGSDYTAVSDTLTFLDGVVSQSFSVPVLDDVAYEGNESLNLTLSNPTGGAGLGTPATASVTITENDPVPPSGSLQFSAASYTVGENGTTATITVARTNGSFGTVGVGYATSDGTATAGSDYMATSGSLSFADGVLSQTFTVAILDDAIYEGNESLSLTLSNPTGGAGLGSPTTASLTINENDSVPLSGSLQFSAATYNVNENGMSANITVTRTNGSFGSVGVDYATSDGTATTGSDYTATSGTLSLADGVLSKSFTVAILDDAIYEGNESLSLSLSNPTGGAGLGSPTTASLTITEDDLLLDTKPPVITPPPYIIVDAKGLLTNVDKNPVATAIDDKDGPVLVTPNRKGPFAPGRNEIKWSATDSSGNTATETQIVDVKPLLEYGPDQLAEPGATAKIHVLLNGNAPAYPVTVDYDIDEAGAAVTTGSIVIQSGTEGVIDYLVPGNILSGDISFTLGSITNAVQGPQNSQTLTIVSENIAPVPTLEIKQNSVLTSVVTADGGPVSVNLLVNDVNTTDIHSYDWSMTDNALLAPVGVSSFMIDPSGLTPGIYRIAVTVTDNGSPNLDSYIDFLLTVLLTEPALTDTNDSDGDGIGDLSEGIGDSDSDGIPDYLDAINNMAVIQGKKGVTNGWLLSTQPGLGIRLGKTSLFAANQTVNVTAQEIEQHAGKLGGTAPAVPIDTLTNIGGYFDFEIYGLAHPGQSVLVVIPQHAAIPDNAVYRIYTTISGWQDFVEDANNALSSASGEAGVCPPPGDPTYISGLNPGHHCVQLMIEDGGPNDSDGLVNGVIADPGGVAEAAIVPDPDPVPAAGGGGGSIDLMTLFLLFSLYCRNLRINRYGLYRLSR